MSEAHGVARDQLRSFITRIERLEEEKKTIADDIKDVFGEAKGMGFDAKILKKVIAIRKMDRDERAEQEAILDTYLAALGMIEQPDFFADEPVAATPTRTPAKALQSPRKAAEAVSERTATLVETVIPVSAEAGIEAQASMTPATSAESAADERRVEAKVEHRSSAPIHEPGGIAISEGKGRARLENADGVEPPPSVPARKTAADYRPHCVRPSNCASGSIHQHCHGCKTAMREHEREEA